MGVRFSTHSFIVYSIHYANCGTNRSSTKKERLEGYLDAGDLGKSADITQNDVILIYSLVELTADDISTIDTAGAKGAKRIAVRTFIQRAVVVGLVGAAVLGACGYLGIDVF